MARSEGQVGESSGMKILVIGSGGREHAICQSLAKDPLTTEIHCAPGNPGIATIATLHQINTEDGNAVTELATALGIDLVVIGPEVPLIAGVADVLRAHHIPVFGPNKAAAELEGSKAFAKEVMRAAGVATAEARVCTTPEEAAAALDLFGPPYVVKDDGLAAGKGVVVTHDRGEALAHAAACARVVIEEFLDGPEVSLFGISDGTTVIPMDPAQDYKRVRDNDEGPNTGGMGAYSPLPWAPANIKNEVQRTVLQPMIDEMAKRGTPFAGLLYAGLALTSKGIKIIEFNARFGDPETEVLLPRLITPLATLLMDAATGNLAGKSVEFTPDAAVTVVLAAQGYPEQVVSGAEITLPSENESSATIFHAGTEIRDGKLVAAKGRLLTITGMGATLEEARTIAYKTITQIKVAGAHYRSDIAASKQK
ncbi:unannotated protein [freshwater metagenome]|uniref:phosphoribosylamine--glycine ligase n=1 Tax=freshwater metagenome TaxID=449393 RepID=A0A6J7V3X4_9ZZZZ